MQGSNNHLGNLNPPQLEAVTHKDGPIIVFAGAGTGKTRVLTRRTANLIIQHQVRPSSILAVTFTNKACGEMRERLKLLLGSAADQIWITTFHSAGLRILRRHAQLLGYQNDFVVYDAQDSKDVIKKIIKAKNIDEKKYNPNIFSSFIDGQKNIPCFPEEVSSNSKDYSHDLKVEVYELYQRELFSANAMDFGDLLANTHRLFTKHPGVLKAYQENLDYVLVDEYQDTNEVQYSFIQQLTAAKKNILVVGDDDQSIYAFRGATIRNILEFEKDYPGAKVVKLEQNYRSTKNILEAAHAVIEKNKGRKPKQVWTSSDKGQEVQLFCGSNEGEEADFIAKTIRSKVNAGLTYKDIAIFYRTNAQSRALEEALLSYRIPYKIFGGLKFYDRKEIKDIVAYLRLIANKADTQALLRIINVPARGIGAQAVAQIERLSEANNTCLFDAACEVSNKSIKAFTDLILHFKQTYRSGSLHDLLLEIIEKSGYGPRLKEQAKTDPSAESRLENLQELVGIALTQELNAEESDPLQQFLDRVALSTSDETPAATSEQTPEAAKNSVSLMTLHLAKGLEFDLVFFSGVEDGLVPHFRTLYQPDEIEEERRLCYVGMTRARHTLYITRARKRSMFSTGGFGGPGGYFREASRFSFDIPKIVTNDIEGDFFDAVPTYEEDDSSNDDYEMSSWKTRKKTSTRDSSPQSFDSIVSKGLIKSAEESSPFAHLPLISAQAVEAGAAVAHPSFGKGVVEVIEGEKNEGNGNFKVIVKFEKTNESKKLIFKYAGLRDLAAPPG